MTPEDILAMVATAREQFQQSGMTEEIFENPLKQYGLDNVDCPICHNTGYIIERLDVCRIQSHDCECMAKRKAKRNLKNSGLADMVSRYTFDNYIATDDKRVHLKQKAMEYAQSKTGWFFLCGKSGSGKTHLCTAICNDLINAGNTVKYMLWRDDSIKLKGAVNDTKEYQAMIEPFKRVKVLYIDDFLKGHVTPADINLAYELINFRYNDSTKRTIISSELMIEDIISYDEALGGRIFERSKGFCMTAPSENWRLKV